MEASATRERLRVIETPSFRRVAASFAAAASLNFINPSAAQAYSELESICSIKNELHTTGRTSEVMGALCLRQMKTEGTIALVIYDNYDTDAAIRLAEATETVMNDVFDGLLTPKIVPIVASPETQKEFDAYNPDCVRLDDVGASGAVIADRTMGLDAYPHIVAVSNKPSCDENDAASPSLVINYGITWQNDDYGYVQVFHADMLDDRYERLAHVINHEFGHVYELGHARFVWLSDRGKPIRIEGMNSNLPNLSDDHEIDVMSLINHRLTGLQEYGETKNVMGVIFKDSLQRDSLRLNALQRWHLQWPNRVLGNIRQSLQEYRGDEITLHISEDPDADFTVLPLQVPVQFNNRMAGNQSFSKLVVSQGPEPGIVNLYLSKDIDEPVDTAQLGYLDLRKDADSVRTVQFGQSQYKISYVGNMYKISRVVPNSKLK